MSDYPHPALLIDGEWIRDRPASHEVEDPGNGEILAPVPRATPEDIQAALNSSQRAYESCGTPRCWNARACCAGPPR